MNDLKKSISINNKVENIEWSFERSENDFIGHNVVIDYQRYYFQMTIDKSIFINYNGFHNRFSQQDLSYLHAIHHDRFTPSYGLYGS